MTGDLRVALVGYGPGGSIFHAPLMTSTPGLRLASVVTGDAGRQEQARRDHPGAQILPTVAELWARAAEHDLAVITTANRAHVPLALAALEAGLPVVVDKPLAPSAADGRRGIAAPPERGAP